MREKLSNAFTGVIFLLLGGLWLGDALGYWSANIFFDGWWTLFIIVPCVSHMIRVGITLNYLIGLFIGLLLLVWQIGIIPSIGKLILPLVVIFIGLGIVFRSFFEKQPQKKIHKTINVDVFDKKATANGPSVSYETRTNYNAYFGSQTVNFDNQVFTGCSTTAFCGGVELDLSRAIIETDVEIVANVILGGCEIYLPTNVKVNVTSTPILGGIDNRTKNAPAENAPTVYINATCVFGGIDLK